MKYEKPSLEEMELLLEGSFLGCSSVGVDNGGDYGDGDGSDIN